VRLTKDVPPAHKHKIKEQRAAILKKLALADELDMPIVYLDEIVFSKNTIKRREWSNFKQQLQISHDELFVGFRTVIAAVSGEDGLVYSESQEQVTNSERFLPYIRMLSQQMDGEPFALYMDQLSVHKTKAAQKLYNELEILPIYNVSYQPELNPIESCFSLVKRYFSQQRLWALINGVPFDVDWQIDDAFDVITPALV
jgi:hypothetical protein